MSSSVLQPPLFASAHHGTEELFGDDLDVDFKLLSEYFFDDPSSTYSSTSLSTAIPRKNVEKKKISVSKSEQLLYNDDSDNEDNSEDENYEYDLENSDYAAAGGISSQRVDKRRERNRVLARKTRLRKKFFFESLQRQVAQLTKENEILKGIVVQHVKADTLDSILSDCSKPLPANVVASYQHANSILEKTDFKLMAAIQSAQRSFCISDPALPDNPIVFASAGFLKLTGYTLEQVLGRNCRLLQGPKTAQSQIDVMRKGIIDGVDTSVCLLNYKADGTEFYNQVFVAALRDENNKIVNYVGVQVEVKMKGSELELLYHEEFPGKPAKKGRPRLNKSTSSASLSDYGGPRSDKRRKSPKADEGDFAEFGTDQDAT